MNKSSSYDCIGGTDCPATSAGQSSRDPGACKGKGNAEEGQDSHGEGGSSGSGGGRGDGKCRHGKQRGKCRECRGEVEAAGGEGREVEATETQMGEKRAVTPG
jgi:hypothetical protein